MSSIFNRVTAFNQDLSNLDISKVTDMSGMFYDGINNLNINDWDTSNVTDISNTLIVKTLNPNVTKQECF